MHVFYALGGGWGHLSRVRTYIRTLGPIPFRVVTANPVAHELFAPEQLLWLDVDARVKAPELAAAIQQALRGIAVTHWYVDAFPNGILGELSQVDLNPKRRTFLARRLKWEAYQPLLKGEMASFDEAVRFEPLHPEQEAWVTEHAPQHIDFTYPPPKTDFFRIVPFLSMFAGPFWLVMHTSNLEEVESLWEYAQAIARQEGLEPTWVLLTDQSLPAPSPGLVQQDPAPGDWFPHVDRIFCGGGFNTLQQVLPYRDKVKAIPFPRRFDDQAERIKRLLG
ncbi:MAG: hypothetical protein AAFQ98_06895 [Bacteroidota bacterium]